MDDSALCTIERGARLFGYEARGRSLKRQQFEVGAALDERKPMTAITMSRRSAKTESVLLWTFAMMDAHDGLRVAFTMATTREAARAKFLADVLPVMEDLAEQSDRVHLLKGAGYERVDIGASFFQVLAPTDKAFRSKEFDIIIIDESGEADESIKDDFLPAALPTLDTSDYGMTILMGTAGDFQEGNLLYDALHDPDASVVDYSGGDDIDVPRLADWEYAKEMLEKYHPGIQSGLTTLAKIKPKWSLFKPEKFAKEYLGVWGKAKGAGGVFDQAQWDALAILSELPEPPRRFALAVAATEQSASIVAAWRENGEGRVVLLQHFEGRARLPIAARDLARKYRQPIILDSRASQVMMDVKQSLEQLRPAARVEDQSYEDVGAAHERIVLDVEKGTVRHFAQPKMTTAFLSVRRVQMGGKWKFGRESDDVDITAAQAATLALRYFDSRPVTSRGTLAAVAV